MVRDHSIAQHYQHQIVESVEMFLKREVEVKFVHSHHHVWPEMLVVPVGVELSLCQFLNRFCRKAGRLFA